MSEQREQEAFDAALEALGQADFEHAAELFGEIVVENPENSEAWAYLGLCYLETGKTETAVEALERALAVDEDNADIHYLLGNAVGTTGDLDRAASCYRRALQLDPQHQKAEEFLIRTEGLLESRQHYRNALRILSRREPPDRYLTLGLREMLQSIAIFQQSPARDDVGYCVREILRNARDVSPDIAVTEELERWAQLCEQGYQAIKFTNFTMAAQSYQEALAYRDGDAFLYHALALSLYQLGQTDEAIHAWIKVLEIDPEFDFATLGRVHRD